MTVLETLIEAKETLIERGWWQGASFGPNGSVCALGSLPYSKCDADITIVVAARQTLRTVLGLPEARVGEDHPVATWNDAPERTLEDVLEAFDKAIALEAGKELDQDLKALPVRELVSV